MKAMVLAAGFGERLRPLTEKTPKPCIKLLGFSLIYYSLSMLVERDIVDVIINTHYLADIVEKEVNRFDKVNASFSRENEILGTGGGLKKVEPYLIDVDDCFVLINSDIVADVDLDSVIKFHKNNSFCATMVLREDPELKYGGVYVDKNRVRGIKTVYGVGNLKEYMFTGIHILEKEIFNFIPLVKGEIGNVSIIAAYNKMIEKGFSVGGYVMDGFWEDFGNIKRLEDANSKPDPFLLKRKVILENMIAV